MNNKYKISIILPTYNVGNYLVECIESILKQSIEKEIVIVDDGSTDRSLEIALGYANEHCNILVAHSQNKGTSAARNLGLKLAQGEYVIWLDPDDTLNKTLDLENIYTLATHHQISIVKGQFNYYYQQDPTSIKQGSPVNHEVKGEQAIIQPLEIFYKNVLNTAWFIQIGCFMIKREFLLEKGLTFEESLSIGEDGLFCIDLYLTNDKLMEVPYVFLNYRLHADSAMRKPFSAKRIAITLHTLELIKARLALAKEPNQKGLLNATLGLYSYYLHQDVITDPEIEKEYSHLITPELIAFYSSFGIQPPSKK